MEKYFQKKLILRKVITLPGLVEKNEINQNFKINKIDNYASNDLNIAIDPDTKIYDCINNSVDILFCYSVTNKTLKQKLNLIYDKLVNGGFLILEVTNFKIPKIELAGMIMYYGFEQVADNKKYIVLRKIFEKSIIKSPSTKFIIALDRVGLHGENIKIHKVRSMYPYSEFLQQEMMDKGSLSSIGKVNEDPRITPLGKLLRKYWIDELPQIYDWLRGKIKLVGIRAMSYPFFNKYPERYKKKYLSVKPGLICPIFDEATAGFEDIIRIEEKYLDDYLKHPIKTDIKLFFTTFKMIFRGTRST